MMTRLRALSDLEPNKQVEFLRQNQGLTRLCFMEYSLNALCDWLPCEKQLLFRLYPVMNTYTNIAVAMCDVFRQDAITSGWEDWATLNKAASASIERCLRVCRFGLGKGALSCSGLKTSSAQNQVIAVCEHSSAFCTLE